MSENIQKIFTILSLVGTFVMALFIVESFNMRTRIHEAYESHYNKLLTCTPNQVVVRRFGEEIINFKIYGQNEGSCEVSENSSGSVYSCNYPMSMVKNVSDKGIKFVTKLKNGNSRATMEYNMRYCKRGYQLVR